MVDALQAFGAAVIAIVLGLFNLWYSRRTEVFVRTLSSDTGKFARIISTVVNYLKLGGPPDEIETPPTSDAKDESEPVKEEEAKQSDSDVKNESEPAKEEEVLPPQSPDEETLNQNGYHEVPDALWEDAKDEQPEEG